tara:strand:+ start:1343 stop:1789 length:447 start_codon:yes stop_codon:yes gene_type:complete
MNALDSFREYISNYNPTTIALFTIIFSAIWLYTLGNTYSYYLNFVVFQATILMFAHNYTTSNSPAIYTTAGIILLYLFLMVFNIDISSKEHPIKFFIKLALVMTVFINRKHIALDTKWINIFTLTVTAIVYIWIVIDIIQSSYATKLN